MTRSSVKRLRIQRQRQVGIGTTYLQMLILTQVMQVAFLWFIKYGLAIASKKKPRKLDLFRLTHSRMHLLYNISIHGHSKSHQKRLKISIKILLSNQRC
jgi:hypothetical protein